MTATQLATGKAFISYSWSSPVHEAWVMELATRLVGDGVNVVLDKWDLQPGHDANAFMEQMVTDPNVKKVLMICDRVYVEKANGRAGGVGKEAQILTAEIYQKAAQDKYVALPTELSQDGNPCIPTYYHSRQYISFVDVAQNEAEYQELLRWIYDKPQYVRPGIGKAPSFITAPDELVTATGSKLKQAEHAIKTSSAVAGGAIMDFGETLVDEYRAAAPEKGGSEPWDETIMATATTMRPALRNLSELVLAEARYGGANFERILRIFESIGSLMFRPPHVTSWSDQDFDAYKMICYEGFLSLVAILIKERRFDLLKMALNHPYLIEGRERNQGAATASYRVFAQDIESMRRRKDRMGSRQIDLYADLIAETYKVSFPTLEQLIQADLLLFVRGHIVSDTSGWERWWPCTIIYSDRYNPTELFARSESVSFFSEWAPNVFGPISVADFTEKVAELNRETSRYWGGAFMGPNIVRLTNAEHLGTRS